MTVQLQEEKQLEGGYLEHNKSRLSVWMRDWRRIPIPTAEAGRGEQSPGSGMVSEVAFVVIERRCKGTKAHP